MASTTLIMKRCLSTSNALNVIKNVTIIGGGLMGSGIAQVTAQSGQNVTIVEVNDGAIKTAEKRISDSLVRVGKKLYKDNPQEAEKFVQGTKSKVRGVTDVGEGVKNADLVIEAIVENIDVKHKLFKQIDTLAPPSALLASNTSSLSIRDIASVTNRKDKFGGLHFFNPVPVMKLLEVVTTPELSEESYKSFMEWGKSVGKVCVTCKDTPGFVVNRLLVPYMAEALRMYERGDASAKDIDIAMKLGAGYPMGPIELVDYVGLDTTLFIIEGWHKKFPDNPLFVPPESLKKLVAEKKFGVKSGEGYYKYDKK
ncbi:probable 3-hydroxyacyl-CoA dehydrogenase B0272.3 [Agrilus planipennis]|uniref:3-hydroxyacyl-CoA dehydrogenase n=1 Tax=Agrilus planipennis TaxID=224129 RepID=A0A1W4WRA7_AGRPL|nr:probable 3-hydroxyacyl-CoA dehydrogenase B0272.3 [Agrilus planipennis]